MIKEFCERQALLVHRELVVVKIKLGLLNSFRPVDAVSPGCSLFPYFPCLSEKSHF